MDSKCPRPTAAIANDDLVAFILQLFGTSDWHQALLAPQRIGQTNNNLLWFVVHRRVLAGGFVVHEVPFVITL